MHVKLVFKHYCGVECPIGSDFPVEIESRVIGMDFSAYIMPDVHCFFTGNKLKLISIDGRVL